MEPESGTLYKRTQKDTIADGEEYWYTSIAVFNPLFHLNTSREAF